MLLSFLSASAFRGDVQKYSCLLRLCELAHHPLHRDPARGAGPQPCKQRWERSPCTGHGRKESCRCFKTSRCMSLLSRKWGPNAADKSTVTGLYPSLRDRRTQRETLQPPTAPSLLLPPCQKIKSPSPNPSTKTSPTANSFTRSPRQKWWLRTDLFVPERLLQLSRAQLPTIFNHPPSQAAFSQPECLKGGRRLCYPWHAAQHSQHGIHPGWRRPQCAALKKGTLVTVLWSSCRDLST